MMVALLPLIVALSAIVVGLMTAVAMHRYIAGYVVATIATASLGYVFVGQNLVVGAYTFLVATPVLLSWVRRTSLVIPVRA
jgi:hypothetical protein